VSVRSGTMAFAGPQVANRRCQPSTDGSANGIANTEPPRPHAFVFKRTAACKQTTIPLMGKFGTTNEGLYSLSKGIKVRSARRSLLLRQMRVTAYSAQESRGETRGAACASLYWKRERPNGRLPAGAARSGSRNSGPWATLVVSFNQFERNG
jgi:hypothetical protein